MDVNPGPFTWDGAIAVPFLGADESTFPLEQHIIDEQGVMNAGLSLLGLLRKRAGEGHDC